MIYKLKIRHKDVGRLTPFPLVYLFEADEMERMRAAFSSFIGFPARHHVQVEWADLSVGKTITGVTRQDAQDTDDDTTLEDLIPGLMRKENPWHFAVVILSRNKPPDERMAELRRRTEGDAKDLNQGQVDYAEEEDPVLGYLKDSSWKNPDANKPARQPAYPPTAYFATREKVYGTLCQACPRYMHHQAGKCEVGDRVCFEAMRSYFAPNMFAKLRAYDEFLESLEEIPSDDIRKD